MGGGSGRGAGESDDLANAQERHALRQRLAARAAERIEELNGAKRPLVEPEVDVYISPPTRALPTGITSTGIVGIGLVLIALAAVLYAGGKAILGGATDLPEKQFAGVNRDATSGDGAPDRGANETEAVTLCDLNMQSQATARSAYRPAWSWRIERRDGILAVRREFSARNPYGVDVSGEYTCLVAEASNRIVGLQYVVAGIAVTVPGANLQQ
jgi:hypothetical protein